MCSLFHLYRRRSSGFWESAEVLLTISGMMRERDPSQAAILTSNDRGATWKLLSTIKTDHDLEEANVTQLHDGRIVLTARPEGDMTWSSDPWQTWTMPVTYWHAFFRTEPVYAQRRNAGLSAGFLCTRSGRAAVDFQY